MKYIEEEISEAYFEVWARDAAVKNAIKEMSEEEIMEAFCCFKMAVLRFMELVI